MFTTTKGDKKALCIIVMKYRTMEFVHLFYNKDYECQRLITSTCKKVWTPDAIYHFDNTEDLRRALKGSAGSWFAQVLKNIMKDNIVTQ